MKLAWKDIFPPVVSIIVTALSELIKSFASLDPSGLLTGNAVIILHLRNTRFNYPSDAIVPEMGKVMHFIYFAYPSWQS
jgi:hypothetical protein